MAAFIDAASELYPPVKAASDALDRLVIIFDNDVAQLSILENAAEKNGNRDIAMSFLNGECDSLVMSGIIDGVERKMRVIRASEQNVMLGEKEDEVIPNMDYFIYILIACFDLPTIPCTCGKCKPGSKTISREQSDAITGRAMAKLARYRPDVVDTNEWD